MYSPGCLPKINLDFSDFDSAERWHVALLLTQGVTFLLLVNNLWKTVLGVHIQLFMENFLVAKEKVTEFV